MIYHRCGCISTKMHMKVMWCVSHSTPDIHQTEEYYH
jgi:hypothetical protein